MVRPRFRLENLGNMRGFGLIGVQGRFKLKGLGAIKVLGGVRV